MIERSGSRFASSDGSTIEGARQIRGYMLYDAYQAQSDIFGPVRLMAETARDWLRHPWPPIGDIRWCAAPPPRWSCCPTPACRTSGRISASKRYDRRQARSRSARRSWPRIRSAICSISARNDARRADGAGRGAAVRAFLDPAARHGRDPAARSRRLHDRLGQCARRAAAARPVRSRRLCRSGDPLYPAAGAAHPCHGGVPALGPGAGGGVAAGRRRRPVPAAPR